MKTRNFWLVLAIFIAVVGGFLLGNLITNKANSKSDETITSLFNNILKRENKITEMMQFISHEYVDSLNMKDITEELAIDLMAKLDPHSVYIPAEDLEIVQNELEGSFSGVGIQFNIQSDTITVVSVISGGPSEKVGLLAGDRIISVDDSLFVGKTINNEKVMRTLRGPKNTQVKLGVKRYGTAETLEYTVTRGQIPVSSVDISYMVSPTIGLIKLNKFGETTYSEFLVAIAKLKREGASKFIIDLRENTGGYLDRAIAMINEFLPANQLIVYTEGRSYPRFDAQSDGTGSCIHNPIAVLIDEFSASASEIFAGAIQDNDRGTIIGRRSFGKGLVQQQKDLSDGSAIRLTVAKYYTPSGRSIQKPYETGGDDEDYNMDIINRFLHGEFYSQDSIHLADSLVFTTLKGRTVYGGGGIMPDIFMPRDTSEYSPYLTKVINSALMYQFAFAYTDKHRAKLSTYKEWKSLEEYLNTQALLNEFISYASEKGVKPVQSEIKLSSNFIKRHITAYISRNILNDAGFYPILFKDDLTVIKAIEVLNEE